MMKLWSVNWRFPAFIRSASSGRVIGLYCLIHSAIDGSLNGKQTDLSKVLSTS